MTMNTTMLKCFLSGRNAINKIGESPQQADGTIKGEETDERVTKVPPTAMDVIGISGCKPALNKYDTELHVLLNQTPSLPLFVVVSAAATMLLTEGHVVNTSCLLTMLLAPYAAIQKRTLRGLGGMRGQQNQLRSSVNAISEQNRILHNSVEKLETEVTKLEHVEEELGEIAKSAQTNVNRLVQIVSENAILQAKIKLHLEQQVIQNVMTIVVTADSNRDWTLCKAEMEMLVMRLKAMPGIEFDEANFRKVCRKDSLTVAEIMNVLRNLLDDDVPEEDNIFHLKPRELLL
jgi:hypothetical protein